MHGILQLSQCYLKLYITFQTYGIYFVFKHEVLIHTKNQCDQPCHFNSECLSFNNTCLDHVLVETAGESVGHSAMREVVSPHIAVPCTPCYMFYWIQSWLILNSHSRSLSTCLWLTTLGIWLFHVQMPLHCQIWSCLDYTNYADRVAILGYLLQTINQSCNNVHFPSWVSDCAIKPVLMPL
jgi:hypothetical protein